MSLTRRQFIWAAAASGLAWPALAQAQSSSAQLFRHGVASGDPRTNRVMLWTRVTPPGDTPLARPIEVRWRIASDAAFTQRVQSGTVTTSADRDFTVKVDAGGLQPGSTYFYAFDAGGERSAIGRTRTLPAGALDSLRLAVLSCANYPAGFFNVYRMVAERDLDAVVHVGDYIYEFANGEYGDGTALKRLPQPVREAISLADYRARYATYRTDADLQEAHRRHPFIAVWDDHELANNAWSGGADNHNPDKGEGDWATRQSAAWRAYMEWMPIREQAPSGIRLYRSFRFGNLADLVMLDTRSFRDKQVAPDDMAGINAPGRRMMDAAQESWFFETLRGSQRANIPWRLVGQQVMFSKLVPPGRPIQFTDIWDGYAAARERVLDFLQREQIRNVAIMTGDLHSSWAIDVARNPWGGYRPQTGEGSLAVELVGPAVSSPGLMTPEQAAALTPAIRLAVPTIKYLEGQQRGYILVTVTPQRLRADWCHATTVAERSTDQRVAASLVCESGSAHLVPA
jgi:alkaline phosphatase D